MGLAPRLSTMSASTYTKTIAALNNAGLAQGARANGGGISKITSRIPGRDGFVVSTARDYNGTGACRVTVDHQGKGAEKAIAMYIAALNAAGLPTELRALGSMQKQVGWVMMGLV